MPTNRNTATDRERREAQRFARLQTVWAIEDCAGADNAITDALRRAALVARPQVAPQPRERQAQA